MKLLSDENFRGAIVRGLLRRRPSLDLVRVPDVGLTEADDPAILAWAATEGRLVLTHDAATLIGFAYERVSGIIKCCTSRCDKPGADATGYVPADT